MALLTHVLHCIIISKDWSYKRRGCLVETNPYFTVTGAVLGFVVASGFAWQIHFYKLKVNLATWTMILILDIIGLGLLLAANNNEPFIQIGWCIAATFIFLAAFLNRGDWKWGLVENWSLAACAIAVLIWVLTGSVWSLLGYVVAVCISVIPQVMQYLREERCLRVKVTWVWALSAVAILITMLGSPPTPKHMIVLVGLLLLNLGVTWLTLRRD